MSIKTLLVCLLLLTASSIEAAFSFRGPHTFSFGPEGYYARRTRQGGAVSDGFMGGAYLSYERLRRCAIYWGAEYSVAYGQLTGHDASGSRQKSWLLDQNVEGRLGYNYGSKKGRRLYIAPFIGYGYFYQTNRFVDPSALTVKFRNTFPYTLVGFQTGMRLNRCWSVALLGKGKWMMDGRSRITGDAMFDNVTLSMEEKWQYEVELPIDYIRSRDRCTLNFRITPFFRLRQYGGKMDFPFDYVETRFRNIGLRLLATYSF